jgi:hypothetical protein
MHTNGRKPLTIVQDKQKKTFTVDLVLVVEEKLSLPYGIIWSGEMADRQNRGDDGSNDD